MERISTSAARTARPRDYFVKSRHVLVALLLSMTVPGLFMAVMADLQISATPGA